MTENEIIQAGLDEVGCWVDGHHGWHGNYMAIDIAVSRGMPITECDKRFLELYRRCEHEAVLCGECGYPVTTSGTSTIHGPEAYGDNGGFKYLLEGVEAHDPSPCDVTMAILGQSEILDQVVLWLTENVAPEGHQFGWYEGEFFLWPDDRWAEEGV